MHGTIMLTQERLREVLNYDPETGEFTWAVSCRGTHKGAIAGSPHPHGYRVIKVDYKAYLAHRLAWFYAHGQWPPNQIDHIDLDKANNRLRNLRLASRGQNATNVAPRREGLKGAYRYGARWKSKIHWQNKHIHLGTYDTAEEAHAAYLAKARELFGEFARG